MWINYCALGLMGFGGGVIVAAGTIALLIGLGIVPRFAGISHTADRIILYENVILLGAVLGNLIFLYQPSIHLGTVMLIFIGSFSGIYLGGWAIAIAEVVNVFPIFSRRGGITKGIPLIIISIAVGKIVGGLFFFYNRF